MEDLFEREEKILNHALFHLEKVQNGMPCEADEFAMLVKEYERILKQLKRITKISDKTAMQLNISKLDLLDKMQYDVMTGIYNRRFLEENLPDIMKSLAKLGKELSVFIIDVDFFKKYNDTYGHSMGDNCLKIVAKTIQNTILDTDGFAARYGGEEFVVILPNIEEKQACMIAEQILRNIRECNIIHIKNEVAPCVTVSIGVTTGKVEYEQEGEEYIQKADKALYHSKEAGRDRYSFIKFQKEE